MKLPESRNIKYFGISNTDELWGIVVTTVGYQSVLPHSPYPPSQHPKSHIFNPERGRVLKEYQLVYVSQGGGYFESKYCERQKIKAGTMILLFPNEWHTYEPETTTGWFEYWVGFKGEQIDQLVKNGFFSAKNPIISMEPSSSMISLYEEILSYASEEKTAYQQIISSMVFYMLGLIYYTNRNAAFNDFFAINKINESRMIMKQEIDRNISPENIAESLGVGYSWFRKMFKQYVGVSPAQYQANLKYLRSKELLDTTDMSIAEIACQLSYENTSRFSTTFRKKAGVSPLQYRKEISVS